MPARRCWVPMCLAPAAGGRGSCAMCCKHFCGAHIISRCHACPPSQDENGTTEAVFAAEKQLVIELLGTINEAALTSAASELRGLACRIPALETPSAAQRYGLAVAQMGGQNCNLDVVFADGVVWIARVRLGNNPRLPPTRIRDYVMRSEVATMDFLEKTKIPAPRVYKYECMPNRVGVAYSRVEKLKGVPLNPGWPSEDDENAAHYKRLVSQIADLYIELAQFDFGRSGSIVPGTSHHETSIGGFAEEQFFEDSDAPPLGPFQSTTVAMQAASRLNLRMIASGELVVRSVENYLRHLWRLEVLSGPNNILPIADPDAGYFLRHRDDKGDHLLVDDDFNITGVLDWEFASVQHASLAFCSPSMMWPLGDFYDGSDKLSSAEIELAQAFEAKGHPKLAQCVLRGRLMQRLDFEFLQHPDNEEEFVMLFQAARRTYQVALSGKDTVSPFAEWKEMMLTKYADDGGLQAVLDRAKASAGR